jgi:hypothetical protein
MGAFTAALAAASVGMQVYGKYQEGKIAQQTAEYNASLYEAEARNVEVKKGITKEQFARKKKQFHGATVVAVSGQNRDLSGSALHVLNDNMTQLEMDETMAIYDLDIKKDTALASASKSIRAGSAARSSANVDAATSLLTGGNEWYQKYGGFA